MRLILFCFTVAIVCGGLVRAAGDGGLVIVSPDDVLFVNQGNQSTGDGGLFIPAADDILVNNQANQLTSQRSSYRASSGKQLRTIVDRRKAAATPDKEDSGASSNGSEQLQGIPPLVLAASALTAVLAFVAIGVWWRGRPGAPSMVSASLAANLVQSRTRGDKMHLTLQLEERRARRAA